MGSLSLSPSKPSSRLNRRLSQLFPSILTSDAKTSKDQAHVLRKPKPSEGAIKALVSPRPPPTSPPKNPNPDSKTDMRIVVKTDMSQVVDTDMPPPPPPHSSTPQTLRKRGTQPVHVASPGDASPSPPSLEGVRPRANSLVAQAPLEMPAARTFSFPTASRPVPTKPSEGEMEAKIKKRRSWLPGSSKSKPRQEEAQDVDEAPAHAWVLAAGHKIDYNLNIILEGEKIPELWDENPEARMFVYLFPRSSGRGPQIKCHPLVAQCSQPLLDIIYDDSFPSAAEGSGSRGRSVDVGKTGTLRNEDGDEAEPGEAAGILAETPKLMADNQSPTGSDEYRGSLQSFAEAPRDLHLYFPVELQSNGPEFSKDEIQNLVDARNLFGFFNGQPLVSTRARPSVFDIFMNISTALKKFDFSNEDGTTFGEVAESSFGVYLREMRLADVRHSRGKTVEGLLLGERMRCMALYSEAFAHAVGKFDSILSLNLSIYKELSPTTKLQLQQSHRDLVKQQDAASLRLTDFDFPSMFSGVASSTSSAESKIIRFRNWKANYMSLRKQVLSFYKNRYGQWPPRASSKKHALYEGGLNRVVLKSLYADLCALYDLLVDRTAFTTRGLRASEDREAGHDVTTATAALRNLLAEYDLSSPPVQPPIPFDTPLIPTIQTVDPTYPALGPKDQYKLQTRRLKEYEMLLLLTKSHNAGVDAKNEFLEMYRAFEAREGRGKNALELQEQRYGHWIFLYAVIQALPMLVTDSPTLKFTKDVGHFLCQMPANPRPWVEDGSGVNRSWYNVAGGTGVVSLPSHMVEYSVEAVYNRSHCWRVAEQFLGGDTDESLHSGPLADGQMSPLEPPPGFEDGELQASPRDGGAGPSGLRPHSNRSQSRQSQRRSMVLGLERLPAFPGSEEPFDGRPLSRASMSGMGRAGTRGSSMPPVGRRAPSRSGTPTQAQGGGSAFGGSTFDDILGTMDHGTEKSEKRKTRKGFF